MPSIQPKLPDVQWPKDEGVIGVVGVAPWATVDFISQVYANSVAEKDWHFPRILVDANSKIPSRGRYFDLGETDPSPAIAETINELISAGATAIAVPCNTAHILFDRWSKGAEDRIVSIVDASLAELEQPTTGRIAVLGSSHLVRHRTYLEPLEALGYHALDIETEWQALVGRIIGEIKVGNELNQGTATEFGKLLSEFQNRDVSSLLLGCTELAQAMRCTPDHAFTGKTIDSNSALARAAMKAIRAPIQSDGLS